MSTAGTILAKCVDNGALHLILLPTEACNFRCTYCFEDFSLNRMEPRVVRGVKNLLSSRAPTLRSLHLSWFGGEPLLALDIIEEVLRHALSLARERFRIEFTSDIVTNGYRLTPPVLGRLLDLGVGQFQISFDGPREWHDRKRVLAGGHGTFDVIWGNLVAMRDEPRDFLALVCLHLDRENQAAAPGFIDQYEKQFGRDRRFRLRLRPLARFGGPNDGELPVLATHESAAALARLNRRAASRHVACHEDPAFEICYAARANSFLIRADGRLNKCPLAPNHPSNEVGRLLEDGRVEISSPRMEQWMRGLWSGNVRDLACPACDMPPPASGD